MTEPAAPQRPLRTLQGVYAFPRSDYDTPGGADLCREAAESRIRRVAREGGHEPEGRVLLDWFHADPDGDADVDLERRWVRARVQVRLNAARAREVGVFCPRCGQPPTVRGTSLTCPRCD